MMSRAAVAWGGVEADGKKKQRWQGTTVKGTTASTLGHTGSGAVRRRKSRTVIIS